MLRGGNGVDYFQRQAMNRRHREFAGFPSANRLSEVSKTAIPYSEGRFRLLLSAEH
jgi:hypothetical protein